MTDFETAIRYLTSPLNGQLPRPWMTDLTDPLSAKVFIVGRNQAKAFDASRISHTRHLDALFNRNKESCRSLYDELTRPSATRSNIDRFRLVLANEGVRSVLETNVICYSSPMSQDLRSIVHRGGIKRGTEIFRTLLHYIRPRILIAHGAGTLDDLGELLGVVLPSARQQAGPLVYTGVEGMRIYAIRSLAPPEWNKWCGWASAHLKELADSCRRTLAQKATIRKRESGGIKIRRLTDERPKPRGESGMSASRSLRRMSTSAAPKMYIGENFCCTRVLILAESNYLVAGLDDAKYVAHWLEHPNFTLNPGCPICQQVGGPTYKRDPLLDHLTAMMLGHAGSADVERRGVWSQIAFGNFIVRELRSRKDRPTVCDWEEAERSLPERLKALDVRAALVLTNPGGEMERYALAALEGCGISVVTLGHPTMHPAPKSDRRAEAWRAVLGVAKDCIGGQGRTSQG